MKVLKCRSLQICDWIKDEHDFPMQVRVVGEDYAYADFEGNEGDMWEFDDKTEPPYPIPITEEILKKNNIGWEFYDCYHFKFSHKRFEITENTHDFCG